MLETLYKFGVIPILSVNTVEKGLKACRTLRDAGLPLAEITFRTDVAAETIRRVSETFPDFYIGAGTVLNVPDLRAAAEAGAKFGVAPGCNPEVLLEASRLKFDFFPGVTTPSDIDKACSMGARILKFFPAEACGGVTLLKALIAPYRHLGVRFIPTGGINRKNLVDYLDFPEVAAVAGSWIASCDKIKAGAWDEIAKNARQALETVKSR